MAKPLRRILLASIALPELWVVVGLGLVSSLARNQIPPELMGTVGWEIHPYQVFTVCTALAIFSLPGAMLVRLLNVGGSWWTRLPTYVAAAIGVWSIPGFILGGMGRFDFQDILLTGGIFTILLTIAAFIRELRLPSRLDDAVEEGCTISGERLNRGLIFLFLIALLIVIWVSFNAPVGTDDHLQIMYVQDHLVVPRINEFEPVFGADIRPSTRGSLTTWPINLAVITYLSGLPAQQAFWILRTPLALLGIFAFYTLTLRFSGKRNQAIFTTLLFFLLALVLSTKAEAIGYGLFVRTAQDKFVIRYLLFPITLAWSLAYLQKQDHRVYWLTGLCTFGMVSTHTIGVVLLGIPLCALGILHVFNHLQGFDLRVLWQPKRWKAGFRPGVWWRWMKDLIRLNWPMMRPLVFLSVFTLGGLVIPIIQKTSPDAPVVAYSLTDTRDPTLWFRVQLAVNMERLYIANNLGPGAYIVHPRIFLESVIVLPALGLPLLWWKARRRLIVELIIGTFILNTVIFLVPPIVQFIGNHATPWLLYRFVWPLTLLGPFVIGWGLWEIVERISQRFHTSSISNILPPATVVLITIALSRGIIRGQTYLIESRGNFASKCRDLQPMLSHMPELVGEGTVTLTTPDIELCLVSSAAHAYPVEFGLTSTINRFPQSRLLEANQRVTDVYTFTISKVIDREFMDILARWNVGIIVIREDHPAASQLRFLPQFFKLELHQDTYLVYSVLPGASTDVFPDMEVQDRWKVARWTGEDPLITANTLWAEGKWDEAAVLYQSLVDQGEETRLSALLGLGRTHLSSGRLDQAINAFVEGTGVNSDEVQAWRLLGEAYRLKEDYPHMAEAFENAVERLDWHGQSWLSLGDAYRIQGFHEKAFAAYERAAANDAPPETSIYYRNLGSILLAANMYEEAVTAFEKSITIRDTLMAYTLLSSAHLRLRDFDAATEAANEAYRLDKWSDMSYIAQGRIEIEKGNNQAAIESFRDAVIYHPQSHALLPLAATVSAVHDRDTALREMQAMVGYKLGFAAPLLSVAQVQLALGQVDDALTSSLQAWEWKPVDSASAVLLGNIYLTLGHYDEAEYYFKTALEVGTSFNEPDTAAYLGLNALARERGDWETAIGLGWMSMIAAPDSGAAAIALAKAYMSKGDIDQAAAAYRLAVDINPLSPTSHVAMGNFEFSQGQFDQAINSFQAALAIRPTVTAAYRGIGFVYLSLGRLSDAEEEIRNAIRLHPGEGANHVALAKVLLQQDKVDEAVNQLKQSLELDPGYQLAYINLADTYLQLGRVREAESIYRQLITKMPAVDDGYVALGKLHERQGDWEAAADIYRQALVQVSPSISGRAVLALADLQRRQGLHEQALLNYRSAITQEPTLVSGYIALANFHAQQGDLHLAKDVLEQGLLYSPASPILMGAMARININQGHIDEAIRIYQDALAISPGSMQIVVDMANLYASIGQPERAMAEIEEAANQWPGNTKVLVEGVPLAISLGETHQALEMAVKLTSLAPGNAESWVVLGHAHVALGQFSEAHDAYRRATQMSPGNANVWQALGQFLASRGKNEEAIATFTKAIELNNNEVTAHLELARIYHREGRLDDVLNELQITASLDATQNSALLAIGRIHRQVMDFEQAQRYFDLALAASPMNPQVYLAQARLYLQQGQAIQALKELQTATDVVDGSCRSHLNLANFLTKRGEWKVAAAEYHKALELSGCTVRAHVGLGNLYLLRADTESALAEYRLAISANPGDPWGYIVLAGALGDQANWNEALDIYEQAVARVPASAVLNMSKSRLLLSLGRLHQALTAANEAVNLDPDNGFALINLGQVYRFLGDFEEAGRSYHRATEVNRTISLPYIYLGNLNVALARFTDAESAYQQAIEISPNNPRGFISLGDLLQARGQIEEAIQYYEQGAEANKSQIKALLALGNAYQLIGNFQEAERAYRRALAIGPAETAPFHDPGQYKRLAERPPGIAQAYISLGNWHQLQSNWEAAEQAYQTAIEKAPAEVLGYLSLGEAYLAQGKLEEALQQFEIAVEVAPASGRAYIALGDWYLRQGDWSAAEHAYRLATECAPGDVNGYIKLGIAYQVNGRQAEALKYFNMAIEVAPTSADALVALGDWYHIQADLGAAEEVYWEAIDLAAANPIGYLGLADLFQAFGWRGEALQQIRTAIEVAPMSSQAHEALGDWYQLEGDWDNAEQSYREAIRVAPFDVRGYITLSRALQSQNKLAEALEQVQTAFSLVPASPPAHMALAEWHQLNLDPQEAQEEYKIAIDLASDDVIGLIREGMEYHSQGQIEEAYQHFEAAIESDPESVLPYLAMGEWYRLVTGLSAAELEYKQAISLAPGEVSGYLGLGYLYQAEGRLQEALAEFEAAVNIVPTSWPAYIAIGNWYRSQGDWEASEEAYQRAIEVAPGVVNGYIRLGELYEAQGWQSKAIEQFELAVAAAGLSLNASVCGPGQLPSTLSESGYRESIISDGVVIGAWRCQWEHRPWALPLVSQPEGSSP